MRPEGPKGTAAAAAAALSRFSRPEAVEPRCDLCSGPIGQAHSHLVETSARRIVCGCHACALLFPSGADSRFQAIPDRIRPVPGLDLAGGRWEGLGVPVSTAFFLKSSVSSSVIAFYPAPVGAVESTVPTDAWDVLEREAPSLRSLKEDVEALLIDRRTEAVWIVPIDRCYELVGRIRKVWQGISGGPDIEGAVSEFLAVVRKEASVDR